MARKRTRPKLDRFATLREIIDRFAEIKKAKVAGIAGGASACLAAVLVWEAANGRTGTVQMSVSRLARKGQMTRKTAARALRILADLGLIVQEKNNAGEDVAGKWTVDHLCMGDEQNDTE